MYASSGYQLSISGRSDEAIVHLESALRLSPGFGPAHRILGCVLQEQGRDEEALAHFETALRDDPDAYVVNYYLGIALLRNGRVEEGVAHLKKAAEGARRSRDSTLLVQVRSILESD
jgi:superkiller protein 3